MHIVYVGLDSKGKNILDMRYALNIGPGMEVRSNDNAEVVFRTTQAVSFAENGLDSLSQLRCLKEIHPDKVVYYLLKKIAQYQVNLQ